MVQNPPTGYHSLNPYIMVDDVPAFIGFLKAAFGAKEPIPRMEAGGIVMHAEAQIGDSRFMMGSATNEWPAQTTGVYVYIDDIDAVYQSALDAGASSIRPPRTEFYGDRTAGVKDAWGNQWWLAQHVEDVSPEEMEKRQAELMAEMG